MVLKCFSVRYVLDHIWQLHRNGISGPLWIVVFWISGLLTCSVMKMLIPFHWTGNLVYISKFDFILTFSFSFWFENVEIFFLFLLSICMLKYVRPRDVWCCFLTEFHEVLCLIALLKRLARKFVGPFQMPWDTPCKTSFMCLIFNI